MESLPVVMKRENIRSNNISEYGEKILYQIIFLNEKEKILYQIIFLNDKEKILYQIILTVHTHTNIQTYKHTHRHCTEKISRSALKKRRD